MITQGMTDILKEHAFLTDDVEVETKMVDLGLDSIKILEMIVAIEEKYGFVFDDNDLTGENFETILTFQRLIQKYITLE